MYYVYVIKNEAGELYYGFTKDLRLRLKQHNDNQSFATKNHSWQLVYYESYLAKEDAYDREKSLKHYGQALGHLKRRLKRSLSKISAG
jgi:putative endonuclease